MKTKIMFILAFMGFTAVHSDAQQCIRPTKKAIHHKRVATVKKSKPATITPLVSTTPLINPSPGPLCLMPTSGRCVVGAGGDISHCFTRSWSGYNGSVASGHLDQSVRRVVVRTSGQPVTNCTNPSNRDFLMSCEAPGTVRVEVNTSINYDQCATGTCTIPTPLSPICTNPGTETHCAMNSNGEVACASSASWSGYYSSSAGLVPRFGNSLVVSSSAFLDRGQMPKKYTCEGQQITPPLTVENLPEGTQTLAVIMYDPNATATQSSTNWMAWNITSSFIPEGFINDYMARNPYSKYYGYTAVCPVGGEHQYHFRVFALDKKVSLTKDADRAMFDQAISGHVLASGEIVGTYQRTR